MIMDRIDKGADEWAWRLDDFTGRVWRVVRGGHTVGYAATIDGVAKTYGAAESPTAAVAVAALRTMRAAR